MSEAPRSSKEALKRIRAFRAYPPCINCNKTDRVIASRACGTYKCKRCELSFTLDDVFKNHDLEIDKWT